MTQYLVNRLVQSLVVFFVFLTIAFFLIQAQPGDFASFYLLDPNITPEARAQLKASFGLDRPVYVQYLQYVRNFFQADFGISFQFNRPVLSVIMERLPRTVILFLTASVISFYLGFVMGKMIAWRRGGVVEYASTIGGVFLYTVFTPWFGLMMIWIFAFKLDWFPIGKFVTPELWSNAGVSANYVFGRMLFAAAAASGCLVVLIVVLQRLKFRRRQPVIFGSAILLTAACFAFFAAGPIATYVWDIFKHMVLPVTVLTLISYAGTMLLTRNAMLETLREDYVLAARAKGLPASAIRDRHVARNALLPVVTSLVFSVAFAFDGGVITETIFSWPGLGLTLVNSSVEGDLPLAVGAFLFTGMFALLAHMTADVLYVFLDPRIRYQ